VPGGGWAAFNVNALMVDADGVDAGFGRTRAGRAGGGRRSSVKMSKRISERPMMAAGWSAKCDRADSKFSRAMYGEAWSAARWPRCILLVK